jgi:predicted O-methyltransferase YrrM
MNHLSRIFETTKYGNGDSDSHLLSLLALAMGSKSKNIIELGVRGGQTTLPLLLAAKENNGMLHSVDIDDTEFECPDELRHHWTYHKTDAIKFLNEWEPTKSIDLIFIDDWHSYDHVKTELEILDRIVSPSTVILLHDLMYGNSCPFYHVDLTPNGGEQWKNGGPYRAVAELPSQFWEFSTLPWNNGLTILRKKYSNLYKQKG